MVPPIIFTLSHTHTHTNMPFPPGGKINSFHNGLDKELLSKEALALTEEEERKLKTDKYGSVEELR